MLKEISKAIEAMKAVPAEFRGLVMSEAAGGKKRGPKPGRKGKKPGPKPGTKRKKPGPKPKSEKGPVKVVDPAKLEKLARLKKAQAEA